MLGMLRDLLGAAASGQRNVVIDTGAPSPTELPPKSTAVFDIDSIGLANVINGLNHGVDPGGSPIGAPTRFVVGINVKPAAADLEREIERFAWKAEAGVDFAITDPVYDAETLLRFQEKNRHPHVHIIAGIQPLQSLREAEYLANEVPWIYVPAEIVDRMRSAQGRGSEAVGAEGLKIAAEVCEQLLPSVRGLQFSTAGNDVSGLIELINGLPVAPVH
jgi:homocysteine S-methyltransferase